MAAAGYCDLYFAEIFLTLANPRALDYISKVMKRKPQRTRKYFAPQTEDKERKCDHPGCEKAGEFRAPKDRSLKDYYWFCLEHVQEYNARWNYYDGISADEPEPEEKGPRRRFNHLIPKSNILTDSVSRAILISSANMRAIFRKWTRFFSARLKKNI